ncbi:unnamed protein product [Closterium sp. NIES-54]
MFGPKLTPQQQLREWQRKLRQEQRNIERNIRGWYGERQRKLRQEQRKLRQEQRNIERNIRVRWDKLGWDGMG